MPDPLNGRHGSSPEICAVHDRGIQTHDAIKLTVRADTGIEHAASFQRANRDFNGVQR
jgi:hypothetical protein